MPHRADGDRGKRVQLDCAFVEANAVTTMRLSARHAQSGSRTGLGMRHFGAKSPRVPLQSERSTRVGGLVQDLLYQESVTSHS
jgi:hypothetical protein